MSKLDTNTVFRHELRQNTMPVSRPGKVKKAV